jgi:outer membrane lipoprotein-sorting protein
LSDQCSDCGSVGGDLNQTQVPGQVITLAKKYMIRGLLSILAVIIFLPLSAQDDPKEIFTRAVDQVMTDQMELSMEIESTDEKGRVKLKAYDILMAKFGEIQMTKMVMQKPERAKGVTVVITSEPGETGVIEVFTPANGKVRKMKATPENMERVGSNMIMTELSSQNLDSLSFSHYGKQNLDGKQCHSFQVSDSSKPQGGRAEFLVEEESYLILQLKIQDEQGNQTNVTSLSDYQPIPGLEGKVQAMHIETMNLEENTQTRMKVLQVAHRPDLTEEDFVIPSNL